MFIGEYQHTVDQKGRLAIPVKFRSKLSEGVVITRGLDNCLFLYSKDEWQKVGKKFASLPLSQANPRSFMRLFLGGAMDLDIDQQGRIVLPEYLRKYANLGKDAVVVGLYNRLEIWDKKIWETYRSQAEEKSVDIAETLGELGI